ncbi:hypothetical protein [Paludisphaera rhizosphaerae]|uniref:hypothetical protein n=1 Tax=Paludisphaera rhizosphaerae TaxID=2711216 RepID=UPI0013EB2A06|nr:hypothetical protein [Paludisphaera rhizosphaerae]
MKCSSCPVAGACVGQTAETSFACGMAERGLESDRNWIRHASGEAETQPAEVLEAPSSAPEFPTLIDQVVGLVGTLVSWARSGFSLAPGIERRRRLTICLACPLLDRPSGRCTACGCLTAVKPWLASADCPQGRWGPPGPS